MAMTTRAARALTLAPFDLLGTDEVEAVAAVERVSLDEAGTAAVRAALQSLAPSWVSVLVEAF